MVTTDALAVWLDGVNVATIEKDSRGRARLSYTDDAFERFQLGTPVLSLQLPLTTERYSQGVVGPFLDGLLPEGDSRRAVAGDFDLRAGDTFGLIRALGRDCAGAIVIQPAGEAPPRTATTTTAERLSDGDIGDLVGNLRSAPLGVGANVRISLAGVQEKLVLTRMTDGSWGRPVDGTPSTHILKPNLAEYPFSVENEALCMRFARHLGLPTAPVETTEIAGRKLVVVERYDRFVAPDGAVRRLHQEDFCQATGAPPARKYEEDGGPSLRRVADILQATAAPGSAEKLVAIITLHVLIGNGDAHAKTYSLLHQPDGRLELAPLYDLISTLHYQQDRLAMHIDSVQRTSRVRADHIINEAARWGVARQRAASIVADILHRAPAALAAAVAETTGVPEELPSLVERQLARLRENPG